MIIWNVNEIHLEIMPIFYLYPSITIGSGNVNQIIFLKN